MRPKKIILCVDSNETTLSVRTFLLETRGYRVITVTNSHEALEILERAAPAPAPGAIDLLIADLLLPGMDGNELVRRAKQLNPNLPALIVSGTVASYERALAGDAFLPKGASTPAELLEKVRLLVARKRGPRKQAPPPSTQPQAAAAHPTESQPTEFIPMKHRLAS